MTLGIIAYNTHCIHVTDFCTTRNISTAIAQHLRTKYERKKTHSRPIRCDFLQIMSVVLAQYTLLYLYIAIPFIPFTIVPGG